MTARLPPCLCPVCESKLDAASAADGNDVSPKSGDVTVCIYCTALLGFTDDLKVKQVDIESVDPELQDMIAIMVAEIKINRPVTLH